MKSFESTEGITVMFVIEVIGKPPKHLTETLNDLIKKIDDEKGVTVTSKKINTPIPMKERKDFYTSFAEIEIEVEELFQLMILMFKYMPSHVDIISPESISLTNNDFNDLLNELTRRLHGYDEVARIIQAEKMILEKKLREILENNTLVSSETKPVKKNTKKTKKK